MKKIIGFLSLIVLLTITSCTDRTSTVVKKEVKVAPAAAPEKKTTIVLDNNGAKVETKKVNVSVGSTK